MKPSLRAELLARLTEQLEAARAAYGAAIEGATHPEARAENDKDTRGLEQSYLARGQAQRVAELEAAASGVAAMVVRSFGAEERIGVGALVTVEEEGAQRSYWIAPGGGGTVVGDGVHVITPASPLGRALIGKSVDDVVEVKVAGASRELAIVALA